ncbi:hypothetical protein [Cellulomonas sp. HD19AZ1]|uniref:hypothetical protein n=1 Tax=Cellulomonas sp. HD19AZ1 TaxID=2559593 RepID=UPI001070D150|nr:hypothetical protein [Cellulomonas sp. HD19AZ1]TFH68221.1 hypothetical protein E4A51_17055 [Cellulomonas sp. HD19AZ1]
MPGRWPARSLVDAASEPIVLHSAYRHGVSEDSLRHALRNHVDLFDVGDGMTMVIGPNRSRGLIEVGVVERHDDLHVAHAMPARPKFLR